MEVDSLIETVAFFLLLQRSLSGQKKRKRLEKLASLSSLAPLLSLSLVWRKPLRLTLAFTLLTIDSLHGLKHEGQVYFFLNANKKGEFVLLLVAILEELGSDLMILNQSQLAPSLTLLLVSQAKIKFRFVENIIFSYN